MQANKGDEMIKLIRWLFTGDMHSHKWEIINKSDVYEVGVRNPVYIDYTLQCKICGNIKCKRT